MNFNHFRYLVPSSEGSQRIVFRKSLPAAQEYTLNYDVMFENDFEFVNGCKPSRSQASNIQYGAR